MMAQSSFLRFLSFRRRSGNGPPSLSCADTSADRVLRTAQILFTLLSLALLAVLIRVIQLQSLPPAPLANLIDSQYSTSHLHARRGALLDRRGRVLSSSQTMHRLYVDPQAIQDPSTFSERLGYALGYDPVAIEQAIASRLNSRFVLIDPDLSADCLARLRQLRLPGVGIETRLYRRYALGSLAAQLLGFVGFDGHGLEGLEKLFDAELAGTPGKMVYLRDAALRPIWIDPDRYQPPIDGRSVRLSLDAAIQAIAETELARTCQDHSAQSGQLIVMDPTTGEILAVANWPSFDPNDLARSTAELRRNRALTDLFEPGSTFKPVIWSAATQWRLAHPNEIIDCGPGFWITPAGRRLHDAHPNGRQTWDGVLIKSSNIGMAQIGHRMGPIRMYRAVTAFGFGQTTGSGLEGESPGMVNPLNQWTSYSVSSIPMGQEIGVTPLQMARAYCVFANGGYLIRPTIRPVDDPASLAGSHVIGRVLSPEVAEHTRLVLRRVVTEGTGRKAESSLYRIFGKTGTAQMINPDRRGYLPGAYIASFIGAAPLDRPRILVACFIQKPDPSKGYYGGIVAAPAVKNVIEQTLVYLGVPPDQHPATTGIQLTLATAIDARE